MKRWQWAMWIAVCVLLAGAFGGWLRWHSRHQAFQFICDTVYIKHYYGREALNGWYRDCLAAGRAMPAGADAAHVVAAAKRVLANIATSHLDVYSPSEDRAVWSGQADADSGMRVRAIDGRFIVARVYKGSAAEAAGIQVGDEILRVQNQPLLNVAGIAAAAGEVMVSRWPASGGAGAALKLGSPQILTVNIKPRPLQIDDKPTVRTAFGAAVLEISSFRQEYFKKEEWTETAAQLARYPSLIVDVRGNLGGDFVAALRALSVFLCEPTDVGFILRPQAPGDSDAMVLDGITTNELYDLLMAYRRLRLQSFVGYPCYARPVTVLMDGDTASVSEIFALAMAYRPRTRIWGERTRGDMLLGVWYNLPLLGPGYSLSVPEALYVSSREEVIEGQGVRPQRELFYQLDEARRGEDSWLKAAAKW